ncbi:MAG TPA: zf-HC2 domain-containing protein [Thermoanaerobaculia bacterium]|nr:zf-HC2 domain-containing protein [Thermoanaerobaculia bacterium]
MNRHPHDLPCEEALDLLEPYVDGDLPADETARLLSHLERCAPCAAELELAARIQRELRALPELDCPPEVLERVQRAGRGEVVPFVPRPRSMGLRIAAAAAMLILALGGGALFFQSQRPRQPSPEEIAQATAEAKLALAYIGRATRRAGQGLRDDVFQKRLIAPATRGASRSLGEIPSLRQDKEF